MSRACHRFSAGSGGAGVLLARLASFCFAAMCVARVVCARSARRSAERALPPSPSRAALASFHVLSLATNTAPLKDVFFGAEMTTTPREDALLCLSLRTHTLAREHHQSRGWLAVRARCWATVERRLLVGSDASLRSALPVRAADAQDQRGELNP